MAAQDLDALRRADPIHALVVDAAERISGWVTGLKRCVPRSGPFGVEELKRFATSTPAIYVSFVRTHGIRAAGDGRQDAECELLASILTRSAGAERGGWVQAGAIGAHLALRIPHERWWPDDVPVETRRLAPRGAAEEVMLRQGYSIEIDAIGLALWMVAWRNTVRLGLPEAPGTTPHTLCVSVNDDGPVPLEEVA